MSIYTTIAARILAAFLGVACAAMAKAQQRPLEARLGDIDGNDYYTRTGPPPAFNAADIQRMLDDAKGQEQVTPEQRRAICDELGQGLSDAKARELSEQMQHLPPEYRGFVGDIGSIKAGSAAFNQSMREHYQCDKSD